MGFGDPRPKTIELRAQEVRLIQKHGSTRKQIEDATLGTCNRGVELPAGKNSNSASADRGLYNLLVTRDAFARKPGVNRAQQVFADRSLGERQ